LIATSSPATQPLPALRLTHYTTTTCLGTGLTAQRAALHDGSSGLALRGFDLCDLPTWLGVVDGVDEVRLPPHLADYDCRNNRLAELGLQQDAFTTAIAAAVERHGKHRIGVFLGTSTAGILQTEHAYRRIDAAGALPADFHYAQTHNTGSLAAYVQARLGLAGPAMVVSTACSSSAKVFGMAQRMLAAGVIDAALVGGVDSLCLTTLYGFNSLQLLSPEPCRPYDAARRGLSLGEAAAFVLLERADASPLPGEVRLLAVGESSDAHHMSAPHPDGLGARLAMQRALQSAGLRADEVDYINLHGTATPSNDSAEARAVHALFGADVPCSSTKGATGHTLGAAGGVESVFCALALHDGLLPGSPGTERLDSALEDAAPLHYLLRSRRARPRVALSNSFGFGGSNCCVVLARADATGAGE
jgi:3-oxoacyl-[acyl-carrier-protein] synthase-1